MNERRHGCNFCHPENLGDRVFNRTDDFTSFVSAPRFRRNHLLVVPADHYESMDQIPERILGRMMGEAAILGSLVDYGYGTMTIQKFQPLQAENGIKMNHLHVHVWPRTKEDEFNKTLMPAPQSFDDFRSSLGDEELAEDISRNARELEMMYKRRHGVPWTKILADLAARDNQSL